MLELYTSLKYGDPKTARAIPASVVTKCKLWQQDKMLELLTAQHSLDCFDNHAWLYQRIPTADDFSPNIKFPPLRTRYLTRKERQEAVYKEVKEWRTWTGSTDFVARECRNCCLLLHYCPAVRTLLTPYFSARFRKPWEGAFPRDQKTFQKDGLSIPGTFIDEVVYSFRRLFGRGGLGYSDLWESDSLLKEMESFLRQDGEGAIIVLSLWSAGCGMYDHIEYRLIQNHGIAPICIC